MRRSIPAFFLWVCCATGIAAQTVPSTEATRARGALLQQLDRAAWLSSDDLVLRLGPASGRSIGGWVVTRRGDAFHIDYFGVGAEADRTHYSAEFADGSLLGARLHPVDALPALEADAKRLRQALVAGWKEMERHPDWKPCTPARFNTIVLPPDADGTIAVYFLSPQVEAGTIAMGGHFRIDVGSSGEVVGARAFSLGCLGVPKGNGARALVISHLLDAQPHEIHVFQQAAAAVPLVVITVKNRQLWAIDANGIRSLGAVGDR